MRYPSGRSAGFAALVWGVTVLLAACCVIAPTGMRPVVAVAAAAVAALMLWIWFGTWYEFREEFLLLRFGPFFERVPYEKISEAAPFSGMVSSMALSSRMLKLRHGENYITGTTYISPKDMEGFLLELASRCPDVKIRK